MTGKSSRDRGARAERAVVNYLRNNGYPDARRHHGADGKAPGDIMGVPGVCIEVKGVQSGTRWPTWRQQLLDECPAGHVPLLVWWPPGTADVGQWDAEMPWWTWWTLTRRIAGIDRHECPRTEQVWVRLTFADAINALKERQ